MNLRDVLAAKLRAVYYAPDPAEGVWLALADECVRQREWARRNGASDTPAPEGWNP